MKNNNLENSFRWIYLTGFCAILALPFITFPNWLFPPDWGKTIIFRSILSVLLFLFAYQFFYKRDEISLPKLKNGTNKIMWILLAVFLVSLLATIFSVDANFSLWGSPYRSGGFVNFIFYILFAIFAFFIIKDSDWNILWNCAFITGILVSLFAIVQYLGLFSDILVSYEGRPPSTMGNPIILGIYLVLLFFPALTFAIKENLLSEKIFYYCTSLLFLLAILISGSRAAYLGILIGVIFFVLLYPNKKSESPDYKKLFYLKITALVALCLIVIAVFYVNNNTKFPQFLENNRIFQSVQQRLSIDLFLRDPRFSAWQIAISALKEKPILGWGPENLSIGFDKYYNPSLPYISKEWGGWWDRAHNFVLDLAVTIGIPGLIIYLLLFVVLLWQLHKIKIKSENKTTQMVAHGMQATIIGYFFANLFFFDTFSTYLLFFLIIGYLLFLISLTKENPENESAPKQIKGKGLITGILSVFLILFLWQYNFLPLQINAKINKADGLIVNKKCDEALLLMDGALSSRSFLDGYVRSSYIDEIKKCANIYPENNLAYAKKGVEILQEAVKIRPLYSRFWIFLGSFTTIEANSKETAIEKNDLLNQANSYFDKALKLAPNHQEVIIEQAKANMVAGNYNLMKQEAENCIAKDPSLGECYWVKGLSEIYLKEPDIAASDIKKAEDQRFDTSSVLSLHQLVNVYADTKNYKDLANVYEKLITLRPEVPEYYSSLAFTYYQLGEYQNAHDKALKFLELMPEAKSEVNAFLDMLPN